MWKFGPFLAFFERGGRGSQSTPGSSDIKIYSHIFLAHLNNGPGFYILSYREVLFYFLFFRGVPIRVLLTVYLSSWWAFLLIFPI